MDQLRIYTLTDKNIAETYFTDHWAKHIKSLPKFGFKCKGVWIGNTPETENQVIALVSFPDNANIDGMTERYMKSSVGMSLQTFFSFDLTLLYTGLIGDCIIVIFVLSNALKIA